MSRDLCCISYFLFIPLFTGCFQLEEKIYMEINLAESFSKAIVKNVLMSAFELFELLLQFLISGSWYVVTKPIYKATDTIML